MTADAISEYGVDDLDILFLENIGNLVCPAEFDTGAHRNVMILSVPEGDDKPLIASAVILHLYQTQYQRPSHLCGNHL